MAKKEEAPISDVEVTAEQQIELVDQKFDFQDDISLSKEARDKLPTKTLFLIQRISYQLSENGMTLEESLVLTNVDRKVLDELIDEFPVINRVIQYKELEFKKRLMRVLVRQVEKGDDSIAQWLLEKRYPEEYGKKGVNPGGGSQERIMFQKALIFIQNSGDSSPIVSKASGDLSLKSGDGLKTVNDVIGSIDKYLV